MLYCNTCKTVKRACKPVASPSLVYLSDASDDYEYYPEEEENRASLNEEDRKANGADGKH